MGKNKYIETPERLWQLFIAYKNYVSENPIMLTEQKRGSVNIKAYGDADVSALKDEIKDASNPIVEIPTRRPLTMEGFECFVLDHTEHTYPDLSDYFECKKESYKEYLPISMRIKKEIRQDQIEGGMVNLYNSSITARLNNLVDKSEVKQDNQFSYDTTNLTDEEKQMLFDLSMKMKDAN